MTAAAWGVQEGLWAQFSAASDAYAIIPAFTEICGQRITAACLIRTRHGRVDQG